MKKIEKITQAEIDVIINAKRKEYPDMDEVYIRMYIINLNIHTLLVDKLNEIIDVINKENQADKIPVDYQDRDDI